MSIALLPLDSPPIAVERRFGVVYPKMERLTGKGAQIALLGGILTLRNLGTILHKSSRIYLFQQALCFNYYQIHDATQITTDYHVNEALCKVPSIQASLSTVDGIDSFLQCLPPLLVLGIYKDLLQRFGLRRLVILNLCCASLAVLYSIAIFWLHQAWTTHVALLSFLFDLIGGGDTVCIVIVTKCIADISPPEKLTIAYNYISAFYFLANVFGSAIGSLLLSDHVYILNSLSIACFLFTACIALIIPTYLGRDDKDEDDMQPFLHSSREDFSPTTPTRTRSLSCSSKQPLLSLLLQSWHTSYSSFLTLFAVPNPTFAVILFYLLYSLAVRIEVLLPQYTSLALGWRLATVNRVLALQALVSAMVLFALPTIRKLYLARSHMNAADGSTAIDLLIMKISVLANTFGILGLAISAGPPLFILSLCVYTTGIGLPDSLTAYGTNTLPAGEEVAEFYVRTGLIYTIAALIGGPFWSMAFRLALQNGWMSGRLGY